MIKSVSRVAEVLLWNVAEVLLWTVAKVLPHRVAEVLHKQYHINNTRDYHYQRLTESNDFTDVKSYDQRAFREVTYNQET